MKEVLSLEEAIIATLNYFDVLDLSLNLNEISNYLYGWSADCDVIEAKIKGIKQIEQHGDYYCLVGRGALATKRQVSNEISKNLWKRARKYSFIFALCPFVRSVAICNSLAYSNASASSDIDVFVVTSDKKLWTARFFLKLITQIFGMRVHHNKISGRYCLSFFVSENSNDLKEIALEDDPHLAYFMATMKPIYGKDIFFKFKENNKDWLFKYFKRYLDNDFSNLNEHKIIRIFSFLFEQILKLFGKFIENFFFNFQIKKDQERKRLIKGQNANVVLKKNIFKFHEQDPRAEISQKFAVRMGVEQKKEVNLKNPMTINLF